MENPTSYRQPITTASVIQIFAENEQLRAELAAAAVMMPARMTTIPEGKTISYAAGYEDALYAVAQLNRNTVSLELLERALSENDSICRTLALRELRAVLAGARP